jgi:hypothetical protein
MKRSNEAEDDFTHLIGFFKMMSSDKSTPEQIERVLDVDALLRYTMVRGYVADWDTFTMGRGKNCFFYERPDGRFQFLHWDSDLGFGDPNSGFYGGRVAQIVDRPSYKRRFHYWLAQFHEKFTKDSMRFQTWLQAEEDASKSYSPNPTFYTNYCNSRAAAVVRELGKNYSVPLEIKPAKPANALTNESITITGTAPFTFYSVKFSPDPGTNFVWKDEVNWRASRMPLKMGTNHFEIQGLDISGRIVGRASTDIVRTNSAVGL